MKKLLYTKQTPIEIAHGRLIAWEFEFMIDFSST
jgi:hypothetical protein